MRVVLEANVLVSALISRSGAPARILDRWERDEFEIAISPAILQELDRVLHYPRLQERFHLPESKAAIVSQIISATIEMGLVKPDDSVGSSRKYARYLPFWA